MRSILTKQSWKELFKPWILERGQEYFKEHRVAELKIDGEEISAFVEGSEDYQVAIMLDDGMPIALYCDCPYASGNDCCKHMAAVLFAVDAASGISHGRTASSCDEWRTAIDHLPADILRTLLHKWAEKTPQLQKDLALLYNGTLPEDISDIWEYDLQAMVDDVSDRHGFVDYRDAYGLMCDMSDYLEQQLRILLDSGHLMEAFDLVDTVFSTANNIDMDDSDGGLYTLFSACSDAWEEIVELANEDQQTELYQKFTDCLNHSEWNFGMDEFASLFFSLPWNEPLLQQNLNLLNRIIEHHKNEDSYQLFQYLSSKEDTLRLLGVSDAEIINLWKEYLHLSYARSRLLEIYLDCDTDAAIGFLCECKKLDRENNLLLMRHSEKLVELYRSKNMQTELKDELQFLLFNCKSIKAAYLQMLKDLSTPEEWAAFVQQMLSLKLRARDRFIILHFEQLYQQLLGEIVAQQNFTEFIRYEKSLCNWSAEQTCKCYIVFLKAKCTPQAIESNIAL